MNNDATQTIANRLIDAGFAVELQPGTYNLILSLDNLVEDNVWGYNLQADAAGLVELPNGTTISADECDHFTALLSNSQISGTENGFTHGVSLFTDAQLGNDLQFLRDHNLIHARLDFPEGGLLIGVSALADAAYGPLPRPQVALDFRDGLLSLDAFGFHEYTRYCVVTPDSGAIDLYCDNPGHPADGSCV